MLWGIIHYMPIRPRYIRIRYKKIDLRVEKIFKKLGKMPYYAQGEEGGVIYPTTNRLIHFLDESEVSAYLGLTKIFTCTFVRIVLL